MLSICFSMVLSDLGSSDPKGIATHGLESAALEGHQVLAELRVRARRPSHTIRRGETGDVGGVVYDAGGRVASQSQRPGHPDGGAEGGAGDPSHASGEGKACSKLPFGEDRPQANFQFEAAHYLERVPCVTCHRSSASRPRGRKHRRTRFPVAPLRSRARGSVRTARMRSALGAVPLRGG